MPLTTQKKGNFVWIEWKKSASVVQIIIKDNGSGIQPEDLHHIFKRFYRSRFSQDIHGIGLGLPLAKSIVEAHQGTISVTSRVGKGSRFVLSFFQNILFHRKVKNWSRIGIIVTVSAFGFPCYGICPFQVAFGEGQILSWLN